MQHPRRVRLNLSESKPFFDQHPDFEISHVLRARNTPRHHIVIGNDSELAIYAGIEQLLDRMRHVKEGEEDGVKWVSWGTEEVKIYFPQDGLAYHESASGGKVEYVERS